MFLKRIIRVNHRTGTKTTKNISRRSNGDLEIKRSVKLPGFFGKTVQKRTVIVQRAR